MVLFQNCVRLPCQLSEMATTADYATFGFIRPVVLKKKIFKDFRFFNQSEAMVAILDVHVGQGYRTP